MRWLLALAGVAAAGVAAWTFLRRGGGELELGQGEDLDEDLDLDVDAVSGVSPIAVRRAPVGGEAVRAVAWYVSDPLGWLLREPWRDEESL